MAKQCCAGGEPPVHLPRGTVVDHYRLLKYLGHGYESTAYLAEEAATGIARVVKLFRCHGPRTIAHVQLVAVILERLHETGTVVRYHHLGQCLSPDGEPLAYMAVDRLVGPRLIDRLQHPWSERRALRLVAAMTSGLAAAHRLGIAIGDFDDGNNVILVGGTRPVYCDIGVGPGPAVNRYFATDIESLSSIVRLLVKRCRYGRELRQVEARLADIERKRITRSTMSYLHRWLLNQLSTRFERG